MKYNLKISTYKPNTPKLDSVLQAYLIVTKYELHVWEIFHKNIKTTFNFTDPALDGVAQFNK